MAQTFLIAYERRRTIEHGTADPLPWLFGIATNVLFRYRRDEVRGHRALARTGAHQGSEGYEDEVEGWMAVLRRVLVSGPGVALAAPAHRGSSCPAVQALQEVVRGELDLLVPPLCRPVLAGEDAHPVQAP